MSLRFDGKVAIVTGAGGGLGRAHALELARRGAKVVVNDLGASVDGSGGSSEAAEKVVAEIRDSGGEAIANGSSVTDDQGVANLARQTLDAFGRADILINNAGILRDKSFAKMEMKDFEFVVDVHLMGSVKVTKAFWPVMKEQQYGRIVMTTSSTGLYGNFGQTNYGAAKLGLVGFMNTLKIEGQKDNIKVNTICPVAATRMTEDLMPEEALKMLQPEFVTPGRHLPRGGRRAHGVHSVRRRGRLLPYRNHGKRGRLSGPGRPERRKGARRLEQNLGYVESQGLFSGRRADLEDLRTGQIAPPVVPFEGTTQGRPGRAQGRAETKC